MILLFTRRKMARAADASVTMHNSYELPSFTLDNFLMLPVQTISTELLTVKVFKVIYFFIVRLFDISKAGGAVLCLEY